MKPELTKLFEMMNKLNPDFQLNEDSFGKFNSSIVSNDQSTSQQPAPKTGDAKNYNKANQNAKLLQNKSNKINNRVEFPEAFRIWFNSLGYSPEKNNITIAMVNTEIRKVMSQLGYK